VKRLGGEFHQILISKNMDVKYSYVLEENEKGRWFEGLHYGSNKIG